jgi:uncharacterized protein (TIGR00106 family)
MNVMMYMCVIPLGVGVSLSEFIAKCQRVIQDSGMKHQMHPYGTVIEGEWDAVFAVVKACHEIVHEHSAPRITTTLKVGTRTDREESMSDKMNSVRDIQSKDC